MTPHFVQVFYKIKTQAINKSHIMQQKAPDRKIEKGIIHCNLPCSVNSI